MVLPSLPVLLIPQFGTIRGGILDGWAYTFLRVGVRGRSAYIDVLAHPPHQPFPPNRPTRLMRKDFTHLHSADHRAARHDAATLIKAAIEAAKQ